MTRLQSLDQLILDLYSGVKHKEAEATWNPLLLMGDCSLQQLPLISRGNGRVGEVGTANDGISFQWPS